uniref:Cell growth-regulating nucleolar protein n=1 Tax=Nannospalax galili TaxID=1026970 RepID=A0A8C6QE65_NANGA
MVFFTCNACGESVKKIQVEKHVSVCRSCECLSCIDCGKDFWGDDYRHHVKCISEDQKYGGKGYGGKTHKGDVKQQAWIQKINELIKKPNVSPKVRELLQQISGFDNIPRKKAKFQNWMKNSLKVQNESVLEQVWSIFSEASSSEQDQQPPSQVAKPHAEIPAKVPSSKTNGTTEEHTEAKNKRERKEGRQRSRREKKELKLEGQKPSKHRKGLEAQLVADGEEAPKANGSGKKKRVQDQQAPEEGADRSGGPRHSADEAQAKTATGKRKRKHSEVESDCKKKKVVLPGHPEEGEPRDHEAPAKGKFNWKGTIKAVLKQAPDNEIPIKRLKRKVLSQYHAVTSDHHKSEEELLAIFHKKISRNPTFKVLKDKVKLLK